MMSVKKVSELSGVSIRTLHYYDEIGLLKPTEISENGYRYYDNESLHLHNPIPELSTSENILRMLRPLGEYTELEAKLLDLCMIIHAEHGGGNNSSFTTQLVTSTGTDTYSAIAAAVGSLKGPKHGGANIAVINMINDIKANVPDLSNRSIVVGSIEAFDTYQEGLIQRIILNHDKGAIAILRHGSVAHIEVGGSCTIHTVDVAPETSLVAGVKHFAEVGGEPAVGHIGVLGHIVLNSHSQHTAQIGCVNTLHHLVSHSKAVVKHMPEGV